MPKKMTAEQKLQYMTQTKPAKLIFTLAVPSIISMLITSFYNMADTYFVGLLGSASASGAIGVIAPLMNVMQAVGFLFGQGSGNHISRVLGAGDTEDAQQMAATGFFSAFIAGCIIAIVGLTTNASLVRLLGATDTILPYARQYLLYLMPGAPFLVSSLVLNNQLRYQGANFYGMIGITSGGILNLLLDPIFIFLLDMGVPGAALATSCSQFISFVVLLCCTRVGSNLRIRFRSFTPSFANYCEILRGGLPSLARQSLNSVATICLNTAAGLYGDAAIAAMSIVTRVMGIILNSVFGFGQAMQPIVGFNYGAQRYDRVQQTYWLCVKLCAGTLIVLSSSAMLFAPQIISLFLHSDAQVQLIGAKALRFYCLFFPLSGYVYISNMMMQVLGIAGKATLLSVSRQGLFFIPTLLLLEHTLGLLGVQMAQSVADLLSFFLALPLSLSVIRNLKLKQEESIQTHASGC